MRKKTTVSTKKRLIAVFTIFSVVLTLLCFRVGYIQTVKGEEYKKKALSQQTKDESVEAKRGKILDRNGNKMAVSATRYSVWVRPSTIKEKNKEEVINGLAKILEKDESEIREELDKKTSLIKIAKYLELEKSEEVRKWAEDKDISAISITEETKRYYPMGNFASHLLGSVTDDNNGLSGLEQYYNGELKGEAGRWIKNKDAAGNPLSYGYQKYYEAENGADLVLTVDVVIQNYAEKALKEASKTYKADRVSCLVMNPQTGEILAVASNPSFDPNDSRTPQDPKMEEKFKKMKPSDQLAYLNKMWRNPLINDSYVPGSTMKPITTAMALEEDVSTLDEHFYDTGSIDVAGVNLKCWRYQQPHGDETLKQAVGNSCNPVFVQLAQRLGIEKYYDYLALFGFTETTGVDYPGEAGAILQNIETAGPVGISTMGFGQGMAVTPIQLLTAISSFGNEGKLMQPHLVKEIKNSKGQVIKEFEPTQVRQTVSKDTSEQINSVLEYVVTDGGAENAQIEGYRVGGKTGTANIEADNNKIIASFVGMAPIENPQVAVLFIVENPEGAIYGSTVAAPGGRQILESSLNYLNIEKQVGTKSTSKDKVTVPSISGKKLSQVKDILSKEGLKYKISPKPKKEVEFTVKDQYPKGGQLLEKGGVVYLYSE